MAFHRGNYRKYLGCLLEAVLQKRRPRPFIKALTGGVSAIRNNRGQTTFPEYPALGGVFGPLVFYTSAITAIEIFIPCGRIGSFAP